MKIKDLHALFLECNSVSTDTRTITNNCMFFALKGENFNGNKFTKTALEQGARFCIIDEKEHQINNQTILVDNALETLQELAKYHRKEINIPIIALTGSNGKTTTKELINCVLSKRFRTVATKGNLNNHIGVPLTLLKMTKDTEIGIVEMGANHQKEIKFLSEIASPNFGLITNFGKAHLEGFGSVEGVIKGKSELYDYLKAHNKTIFVNVNDAIQLQQVKSYKSIYKFGATDTANSKIEFINAQPYVSVKLNNQIISSKLTGAYNYSNIAVAIAIGKYFKIDETDIISAIEQYTPTNNRSQIINKGTNKIILDAYNANPTSMMAALEHFGQSNNENKVLFLGDMFELGKDAKIEHQHIVDYLIKHQIGDTYLIGSNFYNTTSNTSQIIKYETFEALKNILNKSELNDKFILIKGSRGMALERILDLL